LNETTDLIAESVPCASRVGSCSAPRNQAWAVKYSTASVMARLAAGVLSTLAHSGPFPDGGGEGEALPVVAGRPPFSAAAALGVYCTTSPAPPPCTADFLSAPASGAEMAASLAACSSLLLVATLSLDAPGPPPPCCWSTLCRMFPVDADAYSVLRWPPWESMLRRPPKSKLSLTQLGSPSWSRPPLLLLSRAQGPEPRRRWGTERESQAAPAWVERKQGITGITHGE
jgi:hypothetical protein